MLIQRSRVVLGVFTLLTASLTISHLKGYFYSKSKLDELARAALFEEVGTSGFCKTLKYKGSSNFTKWDEIISYEYTCLTHNSSGYYYVITIYSDGYTHLQRLYLEPKEIEQYM